MSLLEETQMGIPHLFRCPISLDLFTDPVTLSTGQTYERSSIEKWLSDGNLTCPVTMQRLHDLSMVPNHTLRHLINQWLLMDSQFDPENPNSTDPDRSLATLKDHLISEESTFAIRLEILRKIRSLLKESDSKRARIIRLGFYPIIVQMLFQNPCIETKPSKDDLELSEEALNCLVNLSPCTKLGSLNLLKETSNLASFLILFNQGSIKIKISLCHLVEEICSSMETQQLCFIFGQTLAILQVLVSLLHQNSDQLASNAAIGALWGLCSLELNRENVVKEGGVDGLIAYLSNSDKCDVPRALATLELLLELESGKRAAINNPKSVHIFVKMVFRVSDHEGCASAVGSLLIICYESLRVREEAVSEGVLTQLLLLLQSQCCCRAKNKARVLLKLLRSMWAEDPSMCNLQYGVVDS
ncbi:U-box domain-containing protein 26-like [Tasmannia lanceolata]|uniref:U-box domain-containing protein 26-like n=1 Tax=Tasmannia lanceolata TaxID=3420 RepID=UPI0040630775